MSKHEWWSINGWVETWKWILIRLYVFGSYVVYILFNCMHFLCFRLVKEEDLIAILILQAKVVVMMKILTIQLLVLTREFGVLIKHQGKKKGHQGYPRLRHYYSIMGKKQICRSGSDQAWFPLVPTTMVGRTIGKCKSSRPGMPRGSLKRVDRTERFCS